MSLRKWEAVLQEIAKGVGIQFVKAVASVSTKNHDQQVNGGMVEQFYERDDISWQAPGRKDHVIIRKKDDQGTSKLAIRSRYMLMSLAEAHKVYVAEYNK